jgi:hypothetical protein
MTTAHPGPAAQSLEQGFELSFLQQASSIECLSTVSSGTTLLAMDMSPTAPAAP